MNQKFSVVTGLTVFVIQAFAGASVAIALEYEGEVRAGIGVTDNVARTAQNQTDETIGLLGFSFDASEESNKLNLNLRSSFDYLSYFDDTFESEWVGGLAGTAVITLVDERLRWVVQDNFGQQLFDPLEPDRPGNRENINFFTTGPTASLFFGDRTFLDIDFRYSNVTYEVQPSDNDRIGGAISFGRRVGPSSTLSLNLQGERIVFDDADVAPPIERYAAFLRYEKSGRQNTVGLDLGYNQAEAGGQTGDGVLLGATWTRITSANGLLTMSGGSRYSDQGNIFRLLQDIRLDVDDIADLADSTEPFLNYFYTVTYTLEQARYSLEVSGNWSQEDYKGENPIDRDLYRGDMRLQREVSRRIFAGSDIGFRRRDFKYIDRRDDDLILGLFAGFRFTRQFDVTLAYQHFQRNSVAAGADFTENRLFLTATYAPIRRAARD